MPENLYFKLLKNFEDTGLSARKSISPFIEKNFKKPTADGIKENLKWWEQNADVDLFLSDVKNTGHFDFEQYESSHIRPGHWYDIVNINARITIAGLAYLENYKAGKRIEINSNAQTLAIFLTVFLTAVTLIVTLTNSNSDAKVDKLQIRIQEQNTQIHTLQIELSKATNELFQAKEATKTLPKKK